MTKILLVILSLTLLSCNRNSRNDKHAFEYKKIKEQDRIDSLRFEKALKEALIIARKNFL
jgi:hypothetical protein